MSETSSSNSDLLQQIHLCKFPEGLKVLVVETDIPYFQELVQLLRTFHYEVTKCHRADEALSFLNDQKEKLFDVVVVDFDTLDMDGFEFLGVAVMASSLPIVDSNYIKECLVRGATAFFGKPLSIEAMGMLWHFAVRQKHLSITHSIDSEITNHQKKHAKTNKPKSRFVWTKEVEALFVEAVNHLGGPDSAVPKRIHEYMIERGVKELNNRHISSHLQKYRGDMKLLQQQQISAQQMDCTSVLFPQYLPYNPSNPSPSALSGLGSYSSQTEVLQGPVSGYLGFGGENPKPSAFLNPNNGGTSSYPRTMLSHFNPNPNSNSNRAIVFHNQNRSVISHPTNNHHHLIADYPVSMEPFIEDHHLPFQEQPFLVNSDVVSLTDAVATFYNDYQEDDNVSIDQGSVRLI